MQLAANRKDAYEAAGDDMAVLGGLLCPPATADGYMPAKLSSLLQDMHQHIQQYLHAPRGQDTYALHETVPT